MPMPSPGTMAKTGEDCPETGIWEVANRPTAQALMLKGNIMPPYEGKTVVWRLVLRSS